MSKNKRRNKRVFKDILNLHICVYPQSRNKDHDVVLTTRVSGLDQLIDYDLDKMVIRNSRIIRRTDPVINDIDASIREFLDRIEKNWVYYYVRKISDNTRESNEFRANIGFENRDTFKIYNLRKIKSAPFPTIIFFVDTETKYAEVDPSKYRSLDNIVGEHELCIGFYEVWVKDDKRKRHKGARIVSSFTYYKIKEAFFDNIKAFWNEVIRYSRKRAVYIFSWNASFDFRILWNSDLSRLGVSIDKIYQKNLSFCVILRYKNRRIYFVDASQFAGAKSLKEIGEILGLRKLDYLERCGFDISKVDERDLKLYIARDVEILREFMFNFLRFLAQFGVFSITLSSIAFKIFRKFMNTTIHCIKDRSVNGMIRKSYFGGRTECLYVGEFNSPIAQLDVNSMYPFIMRNNKFPCRLVRLIKIRKGDGISILNDFISSGFLVIADVDIVVPKYRYGILPYRSDRVYYIHNSELRAVLCQPELELILSLGGKIKKVHKFLVFEGDYIFKDFIDIFWNIRKRAEEEGDTITSYIAKVLMNSLYGKFGQKVPNEFVVRSDLFKGVFYGDIIIPDKNAFIRNVLALDGMVFLRHGEKLSNHANLAIASFITSYARVYLFQLMRRSTNVLYVDTDSLIIPLDELSKYQDLIGNELGQLKVHIYQRAEFRGQKDYSLFSENKRIDKIKGVKKNAELLREGRIREYKYRRFSQFRESLKRVSLHNKVPVLVLEEKKTIRLTLKGKLKGNRVYPYTVLDILNQEVKRKARLVIKELSHEYTDQSCELIHHSLYDEFDTQKKELPHEA